MLLIPTFQPILSVSTLAMHRLFTQDLASPHKIDNLFLSCEIKFGRLWLFHCLSYLLPHQFQFVSCTWNLLNGVCKFETYRPQCFGAYCLNLPTAIELPSFAYLYPWKIQTILFLVKKKKKRKGHTGFDGLFSS